MAIFTMLVFLCSMYFINDIRLANTVNLENLANNYYIFRQLTIPSLSEFFLEQKG